MSPLRVLWLSLFVALAPASARADAPESAVEDELTDLVLHGDADEAAITLESELLAHPERARALLSAFGEAVLLCAATSEKPELRIASVPGLRFIAGGDAALKKLAADPELAVRRSVMKVVARKLPASGPPARPTSEIVESLLSPATEIDRVVGAAQLFLAGLNEPPAH